LRVRIVSLSDRPCNAYSVIASASTRADPDPWGQIGEHLIGKQFSPMPRQERKDAARLEKTSRYRLRIQQFALTIRSTLHTMVIGDNLQQQADRHAGLF